MNAASVRKQLERILSSPGFDASARNRRFLQYTVEETLAGRASRLKGLTIAIDVFGRDPATFDPEHDPVVRIEAAKLRRRLERYYLTAGREDPIRIDVPKGTYVPTFSEHDGLLPDASPAPRTAGMHSHLKGADPAAAHPAARTAAAGAGRSHPSATAASAPAAAGSGPAGSAAAAAGSRSWPILCGLDLRSP